MTPQLAQHALTPKNCRECFERDPDAYLGGALLDLDLDGEAVEGRRPGWERGRRDPE